MTTSLLKAYAITLASLPSRYGMKWTALVSLSTTTYIKSNTTLVSGSLNGGSLTMKSMAMDAHSSARVSGDFSNPYKCFVSTFAC